MYIKAKKKYFAFDYNDKLLKPNDIISTQIDQPSKAMKIAFVALLLDLNEDLNVHTHLLPITEYFSS